MERRGLTLEFDKTKIPAEENTDTIIQQRVLGLMDRAMNMVFGPKHRMIKSVDELHPTVIQRYGKVTSWRPLALKELHDDILATYETENALRDDK